MNESVLEKLYTIWTSVYWWISICVGFLVNAPFALNTEYLLKSITVWACGIIVVSVVLALILSIKDKDEPPKWRMS